MDFGQTKINEQDYNPRETASIFSLLTFFYNYQILKKGKTKDIEESDIYKVIPEYEAEKLGDKLESRWKEEKKRTKNPSIINCLFKCFGCTYILYSLTQLIFSSAIILLAPSVFSKFVAYFQSNQTSVTTKDAYKYAAAVIGLNFLNTLYTNHFQQLVIEYSIKVRTAVCSLIFRKALKLSPLSFSECSIGKIVTLISKDVLAIDSGLSFFKEMVIGFLQLTVVSYILYQKVGVSAFPAVGFIVVIIPLQVYVGKWTSKARIKSAKKTDERFKLLQETLSAIKIIKMYSWQSYFEKLIHKARVNETNKIKLVYYLKALILIMGSSTINWAFYIMLISYIARGYSVEAETVYYVQTCLGAIKMSIAMQIPLGVTQTADMLASLKRIEFYLNAQEVKTAEPNTRILQAPNLYLNEVKVILSGKELLKSVSLNMDKGLLLITGNVGSGKSILLKTILGEYPVAAGDMITRGTFSYASEEPWLFPSTIRQNILFGQPYNEKRYQEVLNACALTYDINQFEKLDQTIVGDRGINLSKGQQARVNLARAVYKESDIYLLDDCLCSLDNQVNKHIFNECIKKFLKDKICLLVTNNINHIKTVNDNKILFIENGATLTLEQQYYALDKRITYYIDEESESDLKRFSIISKTPEIDEILENDVEYDEVDRLLEKHSDKVELADNLYHEEKKQGKVLWSTYGRYFRSVGGIFVMLFILTAFVVSQFCLSYSDKLLSLWVNLEPNITKLAINNQTSSDLYKNYVHKREYFLNFYTILMIATVFLFFLRSYTSLFFLMNGARKLHQDMLSSMLNAYMYFFDNHFIGNIINRLSKDFHVIDEHMPYLIFDCCRLVFNIAGVLLLVASVNWTFFIPAAILLVKLYFVRRFYVPTGRSLRRLEAATRSPIIGYLNSSLEGLATIRASNQQTKLQEEFDRHQDLFTSTFYMNQSTMRFFSFLLDLFGSSFLSGLVIKFIVFPQGATAGDVGLAISQSMTLSGLLQYTIRQITEVENTMTSVERVAEYSDVKTEPKTGQILSDWPSKGAISYQNVSLTYKSDGHPVLKNINIEIESQSKIGIVGRTGAGKSSIISTLFRLYDFDGKIFIDGEDISKLSLEYLRANIAIIPQDPVLFTGTIRTNVDPFSKYSDTDVWAALEKVHLKSSITSLNQEVHDAASTYSSGQRQLFCLARAVIQDSKIIVLDEATANLDPETDQLLQKTVMESFKNCTVITIAHRLHSVMSCDKILVLDAGFVVEFDKPAALLANPRGFLSKMINEENISKK